MSDIYTTKCNITQDEVGNEIYMYTNLRLLQKLEVCVIVQQCSFYFFDQISRISKPIEHSCYFSHRELSETATYVIFDRILLPRILGEESSEYRLQIHHHNVHQIFTATHGKVIHVYHALLCKHNFTESQLTTGGQCYQIPR